MQPERERRKEYLKCLEHKCKIYCISKKSYETDELIQSVIELYFNQENLLGGGCPTPHKLDLLIDLLVLLLNLIVGLLLGFLD